MREKHRNFPSAANEGFEMDGMEFWGKRGCGEYKAFTPKWKA